MTGLLMPVLLLCSAIALVGAITGACVSLVLSAGLRRKRRAIQKRRNRALQRLHDLRTAQAEIETYVSADAWGPRPYPRA